MMNKASGKHVSLKVSVAIQRSRGRGRRKNITAQRRQEVLSPLLFYSFAPYWEAGAEKGWEDALRKSTGGDGSEP